MVNEIERQIESRTGVGSLPDVTKSMKIRPRAGVGFGELDRRHAQDLSAADCPRHLLDRLPGISLQRRLFHVSARPAQLLRRGRRSHRFLHPAVSPSAISWDRSCWADSSTRRPQADDRGDVYRSPLSCWLVSGYLFQADVLTPTTQTLLWAVVFFFASSAASSAYLTVSEIFPVELRGMVIALFFATGTLIGGTLAPASLAGSSNRVPGSMSSTATCSPRPCYWRRSRSWPSGASTPSALDWKKSPPPCRRSAIKARPRWTRQRYERPAAPRATALTGELVVTQKPVVAHPAMPCRSRVFRSRYGPLEPDSKTWNNLDATQYFSSPLAGARLRALDLGPARTGQGR